MQYATLKAMKRNVKNKPPLTVESVAAYLEAAATDMKKQQIARAFDVHGETERQQLKTILAQLKKQGLYHKPSRKRGADTPSLSHMTVRLTCRDDHGNWYAKPVQKLKYPADIMIPAGKKNTFQEGDLLHVSLKRKGRGFFTATVLHPVSQEENHMLGVYENGKFFLIDRRFKHGFPLTDAPTDLKNKDLIIADMPLTYTRNTTVQFIKKLGNATTAFAPTLISVYDNHLPVAFSEQAEKEAEKATVPPVSAHRKDVRNIPFVTIDGADAKDFDDAVWAEKTDQGFHVMVAIADVSWYVRPGSALDKDAFERGNSVYFPDRVLPMLPFALSDNMCSLMPHKSRAAMICEIWLDKSGTKLKHTFYRALIRSTARLTYDEVQNFLDGTTPSFAAADQITPLFEVFQALAVKRKKRGTLELDVPERQVLLNDKGQVIGTHLRVQTDSHKLIEEFMILANIAAAETLEQYNMPTMYRIHDAPSEEKIEMLNNFLKTLHLPARFKSETKPTDFNKLLTAVKGKPNARTINDVVLRTQSQAEYNPQNIGHFGLSLARYAHFTSPIRRYADIMIHRALVSTLNIKEGALPPMEEKTFADIATHISQTERIAQKAERDAVDRYIARYLADKTGQRFTGRISSVNAFGLFIELEEFGADGFVPMKYLTADYFDYDPTQNALIGRNSNKRYDIGQKITLVLMEALPLTGGLIFKPLK